MPVQAFFMLPLLLHEGGLSPRLYSSPWRQASFKASSEGGHGIHQLLLHRCECRAGQNLPKIHQRKCRVRKDINKTFGPLADGFSGKSDFGGIIFSFEENLGAHLELGDAFRSNSGLKS